MIKAPVLTIITLCIAANIAAIEAQRDFWLATTDLDAAVVGGGVVTSDNPMTSPADTTANK